MGRKKTENPLEQNRVESFKKMCRLLEMTRRDFLQNDWRHFAKLIPRQQFTHLMMIRQSLPCNLSRIMALTGLTSAGASIFVDKLVKLGVLERMDNPDDRRNLIVRFSPRAAKMTENLDDRLDRYIFSFFANCSPEELAVLEQTSQIVCHALSKDKK